MGSSFHSWFKKSFRKKKREKEKIKKKGECKFGGKLKNRILKERQTTKPPPPPTPPPKKRGKKKKKKKTGKKKKKTPPPPKAPSKERGKRKKRKNHFRFRLRPSSPSSPPRTPANLSIILLGPGPLRKSSILSARGSSPFSGLRRPYLSKRSGRSTVASEGAGEGDLAVSLWEARR